jgi:hypothetical protein
MFIEWERQKTDGAVAGISAFRLFKQNFVTQLSHPFFACSFMLRPMFFLALIAAISNGFTGACLQLYFVDFCDAAGSANFSHLSVFAGNHHFSLSFTASSIGARINGCACWVPHFGVEERLEVGDRCECEVWVWYGNVV